MANMPPTAEWKPCSIWNAVLNSAPIFEREKQLAEIYLVGQRAADEALESCVKWLALECRERSTIAELVGISLDMMTGKSKH